MKKYKAIVIDGKKCLKRLLIFILLAAVLLLTLTAASSGHLLTAGASFTPGAIIRDVFPAAGAANDGCAAVLSQYRARIQELLRLFLNFHPAEPSEILVSEIPLIQQVRFSGLLQLAEAQSPAPSTAPSDTQSSAPTEENQAPIKSIDASPNKNNSKKIALGNETSYSVDLNELLASPPDISMAGEGPKVLVIHTHATESYAPEGSTVYDIDASDRSQNKEENVVRVGQTLCEILQSKHIPVIHDTELHDYPSFNGSYGHALAAIEEYLKRYPSIQVVFDVHRDSIVYDDNTKAKVLTRINGRDAAQLMFVVGTDEKGLYHPDWRENLKTAVHFQNAINQKYPTLMRHINLRQERFNGHATHGSLIIETGSSGNSLSEAEYGLSLAAECIADYLNTLS